ncbi:hypothetical protein [Allohahella sp. A8]|uniref:hypothetical protein n=1 Tax=Allohahella sp. A8 TaxID=3141461 RepID=UPI003A811C2C
MTVAQQIKDFRKHIHGFLSGHVTRDMCIAAAKGHCTDNDSGRTVYKFKDGSTLTLGGIAGDEIKQVTP